MKKMKYIGLLTLALFWLAACMHDELSVPIPNENIRPAKDFINNNYEMTLFAYAIKKTGYSDMLNGPGPFTILVPPDGAFNDIGIYTSSDLDRMKVDSLKKLIGYHVLPRRLRMSDVPTNGVDVRYSTLEGTQLYASLASFDSNGGSSGNDLYFGGAKVSRSDVVLSNGVLHVLEKVMKPAFGSTTQQWLAQQKDYSVFVAGLKKFNLWNQLATAGPFTIFAPDNKALEEVGITMETISAMNASEYKGERLFGCYLLYDRHFFISDLRVFDVISSDGRHLYFLRNDSHYMELYSFFDDSLASWGYELKLMTGNTVVDQLITIVNTSVRAKTDNLCSNGVVHYLKSGLVSPEQALKN